MAGFNGRHWCECGWIVVISVFMWIVMCSDGFNVDTINFIRHRGEPGSMFGFSVAEHKERGRNWVLIGAPEAQTRQPGVTRGGAVFRCEINKDDACEEIPFDNTGNNNNTSGRQIDKKSNQWFGATVRSSGETGIVLACAPRYVWFSTTTAYRRDPVGTCYVAKNYFSDFSEYSPCRTRNWGYHRQGSCQAGLGADVSKNGQRLYVGAPGSWYWQGQIYDITSTFKMPSISPDYSKNNELNLIEYESGQLFAQNPNKRPEVLATAEGPPQDDDSYLGYSVAAGDFDGRGEGGVAVGMPRGAKLLGKVVLYSLNLTNLLNITGHQLGAYFSYSLAVNDVDGDGLDDVIIGAPLYTDLNNNEGKYETGRVYIYYQDPRVDDDGYYIRFARYDFRDGKNTKGRFGLSLASLGDINKDGFGDFAVGAPYDGPEGRGAVYIYHGVKGGVRENYAQVIRAEELSVSTSTFGFSISGGLDMDDNQYPDLVIGAYESDTAFFFRSRPVVKMVDARISFSSKTKQISLEEESCTLRDYTKVPCVYLQVCLKYSGVEVERVLDVDIGVTLDSKKTKSPRMFFLDEEGRSVKNDTIRLNKGELNCKSYYVYVKPNIRDKLTALEAELRYSVRDTSKSQVGLGRRYNRSLDPVIDTTDLNIQRDTISIRKNCGVDNICIPNLKLTTRKSVNEYLLGSGERFYLDVTVQNSGEDAFEATYNLQIPPGMNYINIERLDSDRGVIVQCSAPSAATNNTLRCDIGNPLPKDRLVRFKVLLQPFHREGMKARYVFKSSVNSTNPEDDFTIRDNIQEFSIPISITTDLILQGTSHPPDVHLNFSHYTEENITFESEIGPQVVHVYGIRNKGPSDILEAEAVFVWPSYTLAGDHLLYLLEQPETSGKIKCEHVEEVNELRIELDRKRKFYLDTSGMSSSSTSHYTGSGTHYVEGSRTSETRRTGSRTQVGGAGGSRRVQGQGKSKAKASEEEKRRLEEEEVRRTESELESGDGSTTHRKRIQSQSTGSVTGTTSSSSSSTASGSRSSSSWSEERRTSQSLGSRRVQESSSSRNEERRQEVGGRVGGGVTEKVTYEEGSYRPSGRGEAASAGGSHFQWTGESSTGRASGGGNRRRLEEERRLAEERRLQEERRIEEERRLAEERRIADERRIAEERRLAEERRVEEERRRIEYERRRVSSQDSSGYGGRRISESERGYAARNDQVSEDALHRAYGGNEFRTVTLDIDPVRAPNIGVVDFGHGAGREINKNEIATGRAYEGSRTYEGGRTYEHEERRRIEAEAAAAGAASRGTAAGGRHYSTEYEYHSNSSWDSATGGRPRVDSSSRWSINDNGTVHAGSSSGYDADYERRLHEERERRLREESRRKLEEEAARQLEEDERLKKIGERYYNSSYSSERRYSSTKGRGGQIDPDLGYVRENKRSVKKPQQVSSEKTSESSETTQTHQRYKRHHYVIPRYERDVGDESDEFEYEDLKSKLKCGHTKCTKIRCTVGPLAKGQEAFVALRGRVWVQTLKKIGHPREILLSSLQASRVTRLPHIGVPHNTKVENYEVLTEIMPQDVTVRPEVVPLWIVVLSACAGTLILLLLIFLLYKLGFFKRNRPSNTPEKQPLNKNGYQHGDEAL